MAMIVILYVFVINTSYREKKKLQIHSFTTTGRNLLHEYSPALATAVQIILPYPVDTCSKTKS